MDTSTVGRVLRFPAPGVMGLLFLILIPRVAQSQTTAGSGGSPPENRVGAYFGLGNGPSPSGMAGIRFMRSVSNSALGFVDYTFLTGGVAAACSDSWPDSYSCSIQGHSFLLGSEIEFSRESWAHPFVHLALGGFRRSQGPTEGRTSLTPVIGGGVRLSPGGAVSWKLFARRHWMFDQAYADLMEEDLRFWFLGLEMELHPWR